MTSLGWLESRTLLASVVGPMPVPAAPDNLVVAASVGTPSPAPAGLTGNSGDGNDPTAPADQSATTDPDGGQTSASSSSAAGTSQPSDDRSKNHVAIAVANIEVNGVSTPEFVLADAGKNEILVKVGVGGQWTELGSTQGIDAPQSVVLTDVNGDGIPDLLVANSGANNILVFPGLPGGLFGPEVNGGNGFAVGTDPVGITVGDINADGVPDLIVANKGSDTISILDGEGTGSNWTLTLSSTINVVPDPDTALATTAATTTTDLATTNAGFAPAVPAPDPAQVTATNAPAAMAPDPAIAPAADSSAVPAPDPFQVPAADSPAAAAPDPASAPAASTTAVATVPAAAPAAVVSTAPVKTVLYDLNDDGLADLFVCNSGTNDVYMYQGQPDGTFDTADPTVFPVGLSPVEMFVGHFDKRSELDLVTVNSGSDDVTFIGGVLLPNPTSMSISSGGTTPDAAFAVDPNQTGVMDLVVANSGDGHLALIQAANEGMQLAGVITQADIPVPTGLSPASSGSGGIDFFAAGAGLDAAELLHFDLGTASLFLPTPLDAAGPFNGSGEELFAQLLSFDDSSLELMAVYWTGGPDSSATGGEWGLRDSSTVTALYSPTEGQGADESTPTSGVRAVPAPSSPLGDPSDVDSSATNRFVTGVDAALGKPRGPIEAVAARDAREIGDGRPVDGLVQVDRRPVEPARDRPSDPDVEAAAGAVDEALRLLWSEGRNPTEPEPVESAPRFDPIRELEGVDAPARDGRLELFPAVSSALLFSTRLILQASPPRPPTFRRKPGLWPFGGIRGAGPGRDRPDRV